MPIQKRVSDLPAATGIVATDAIIMSSASATKRVSFSQLSDYFATQGFSGPTGPTGAAASYQADTAPTDAPAGATWLSTTDGRYYVRYDGVWVEVGGKHYP
jgi:hypothetical protein